MNMYNFCSSSCLVRRCSLSNNTTGHGGDGMAMHAFEDDREVSAHLLCLAVHVFQERRLLLPLHPLLVRLGNTGLDLIQLLHAVDTRIGYWPMLGAPKIKKKLDAPTSIEPTASEPNHAGAYL
jgi:hypothetical protein